MHKDKVVSQLFQENPHLQHAQNPPCIIDELQDWGPSIVGQLDMACVVR